MAFSTNIDVKQVQSLVSALQANDQTKASEILDDLTQIRESELYQQLAGLTSNLHHTLDELADTPLLMQTKHDIPDVTERLEYVIKTTEDASAQTLDMAEQALQKLDHIKQSISNDLSASVAQDLQTELSEINEILTNIMLAQSFQDLTGQVLNRVIFIISSLEQSLIQLIDQSGHDFDAIPDRVESEEEKKTAEMHGVGPNVTKASQKDIVDSQKGVDDLLSDLGI